MKKDESKLTGIVYFCDNLKKEVILKVEDVDNILSVYSQECDICGSHGTATLYIRGCECGK